MVLSRIVVGRAIVDPDDVDVGRFLLSAEDALVRKDPVQVDNDGKGEGIPTRFIDGDETYARQIQNDYLQEVLRVLEDYRYAKSLAGCTDAVDQPEKSSVVDKFAMDYLEALLATSETQSEPSLASPDFVYTTDDDNNSDTGYSNVEDESIWIPKPQSPREAAAEAAERRKLSLSLAISAGLPGPSGRCSSLFSDGPTSEDGEYDQWNPVSENLSSPDDQDNGDGQCGRNAAIYDCTDNGDVDGMDNVGETHEQPEDEQDPDITQVIGIQFDCPTVFCLPCGDLVVGEPTLQAPCGHNICVDCVCDLVQTATRDESLFPPSCCHEPFSSQALLPFLTVSLEQTYNAKQLEFAIPSNERIFCPNSTCSAFLGSSKTPGGSITCTRCSTTVCISCKQPAHPGEGCAESASTSAVKQLAEKQGWKTCPKCRAIVEKTSGCNHIICRCSSNFCYGCGGLQAACKCGHR